jgi:HlyD family secretion protein
MLPRVPYIEARGGPSGWVVDGDAAVRRPIRLGASSVTMVEVLDGLAVGDQVVISGTDTFGDAERVQLND